MLDFVKLVATDIAKFAPGKGAEEVVFKYAECLKEVSYDEELIQVACKELAACIGREFSLAEITSRYMNREVVDFLVKLFFFEDKESFEDLKKDVQWQKLLVMLFNLFVARLCGANILEASLEVRASHLVHAADKFFSTMTDMVEHMSIMAKWGGYLHDPEILVLCSDAVRELPNAEQESFLKTLAHVVGSKDEKPTRDELVQLLLTIKLGVKGLN